LKEHTYAMEKRNIRYIIQVDSPSQQSQLDISYPRLFLEFCFPRYRVDDGPGIGTQNCDNTYILPLVLQPGKYILVTHGLSASSGWVLGRRRGVHFKEETLVASPYSSKFTSTEDNNPHGYGHGVCGYVIEKAGV